MLQIGRAVTTITELGVDYHIVRNTSSCSNQKFRTSMNAKCVLQLGRIKQVGRTMQMRIRLVRMLITPKLRFAGAWRTVTHTKQIALSIERTIGQTADSFKSPSLRWIVELGHDLHPDYIMCSEALFIRVRQLRQHAIAQLNRDIQGIIVPAPAPALATERVQAVCHTFGWTVVSATVVNTQLGLLDLSRDCKATITNHCVIGWQRSLFDQDKRGLSVDFFDAHMPVVSTHKQWWNDASRGWLGRYAAVGSSPDYRNFK